MDNRILDALFAIRDTYGDAIFYNITTSRNLLADLAPDLRKERIQITHFLEMGGYFPFKYAGKEYEVVRTRLIDEFIITFSVNRNVAEWVLDIYGKLLGFDLEAEKAMYKPPKIPTAFIEKPRNEKKETPQQGRKPLPTTTNAAKSTTPALPQAPPTGRAARRLPSPTASDYTFRFSADYHTVAITRDGFVKATGPNSDGQCNTITYDWRDMAAVSAGASFTVGLRADGTVIGTGRNDFGQRDFTGWREVVGISAGVRHTVGLRADGTVLSTGYNKNGECNVRHWRNIIRVVAGNDCTFGIKKDGRVLVSGQNTNGDLKVSHLNGVVDIAYGGPGRVIALLTDGRIARVGQENHMRRNFTLYKDIKQISAAPDYFAGLMANGTVKLLAYFWTDCGTEAATADWRGITAIAAGRYHILGLKKGKLIGAMLHPDIEKNKGQLNASGWEM
jgi:alpha-tubulin suppressor-like RCC1 family protein